MRYLFGLRGDSLTIQAIAPDAQRLIDDIEHISSSLCRNKTKLARANFSGSS